MGAYIYISFFALLISSASCRREEIIGREVQIGSEDLLLLTTDSIHITASTVVGLPERTDERFDGMLGSYFDPIFGTTTISYHGQFVPNVLGAKFPSDAILDSAYVSVRLVGGYRDKTLPIDFNTPIHYKVYELSQDLHISSIYTSKDIAQVYPDVIGEFKGEVSFTDSIVVNDVLLPPLIHIPLTEAWGEKILRTDSLNMISSDAFTSYIKGISIRPVPTPAGGIGAILYISPYSIYTGFVIHYHTDTDTTSFSFVGNAKTSNFMTFDHDYSGTPVEPFLGDTSAGSKTLYLQATIGTDIALELKDISEKFAQGNKIINKAELIIPVDTMSTFNQLFKLSISRQTTSGYYEFLPDQVETGSRIIDGNYNGDSNYYRFLITQYVQEIVNDYVPGVTKSEKLRISAFDNNIVANRSIISGPRPVTQGIRPMKIRITYTP